MFDLSALYVFCALVVLLIGENIWLRVVGIKRLQLEFNSVVLLLLVLDTFFLMGANNTYAGFLSINAFSTFFILLFTSGMFLLNLIAYSRSRDYQDFAILSSFALVGMYFVAFASSLITIFLGLELVSVPSAFIVLLSKRDSIEAATKFFVMASVAVALLSFAIVLVYGAANSLTLSQQPRSSILTLALVLFIASLGFEASVFPFNVLLPDVYQGSGAYATAMLGGINKKVGFAALLQVLVFLFFAWSAAFEIVAILSVLTMLYGNVVALVQDKLKRLLAYSSISQAGYILIGIAVDTQASLSASLFLIFAHVFLFIGAMSIIAWLESKGRTEVNDLIGLHKENRFVAFALTIFLVALVGVPLTTGFVGKFLIFLSAVNAGLAWLAVIGIGASVVSIFYYVKMISAMYTSKLSSYHIRPDTYTFTVVLICLAVTILFGLYPQPILQLTNGAATYLLHGVA